MFRLPPLFSRPLTAAALVAFVALASACAGSGVSSERQVLPDFDAKELSKRRLLLAPYATRAVDAEASVPLEREEMQLLALETKEQDPELGSLKAFYAAGALSGQRALEKAGTGLLLQHVETARWGEYFAQPETFLSVTVDGKARYEVPPRELLQRLGTDADYVLVLGELKYQASITRTKLGESTTTRREAECDGRFLVWDYGRSRALAEGSVESVVGFGKRVTASDFKELGELLVSEILAKRPFTG